MRALETFPAVALVCPATAGAAKDACLLAEATLSTNAGLVLLDRLTIGKVLAEQHLSLDGLVSPEQALKMGALLKVDVFAVVRVEFGSGDAVGLVAFRTQTGERLWDAAISSTNLEGQAADLARNVQQAVYKYNRPRETMHTLCVASIRNKGLPQEMDPYCRAIGVLLERHLVARPDITLLERTHLQYVTAEAALHGVESHDGLLAAATHLELEIDRGSTPRTLRVNLRLVRQGAAVKALSIEGSDDPEGLARQIVPPVAGDLPDGGEPCVFDRLAEARRFLAEGSHFAGSLDYDTAAEKYEVARALDGTNIQYQLLCAHAYIAAGNRTIPNTAEESTGPRAQDPRVIPLRKLGLQKVLHGMALLEAARQALDRQNGTEWLFCRDSALTHGIDATFGILFRGEYQFAPFVPVPDDPDDRDGFGQVSRLFHALCMEDYRRDAAAATRDKSAFLDFTGRFAKHLNRLRYSELPSDAFMQTFLAWMRDWLVAADRYRPDYAARDRLDGVLSWLMGVTHPEAVQAGYISRGGTTQITKTAQGGGSSGTRFQMLALPPRDVSGLAVWFASLQAADDPYRALVGKKGNLWLSACDTNATAEARGARAMELYRLIEKSIADPARAPRSTGDWLFCFRSMIFALEMVPDFHAREAYYLEICRLMLRERKLLGEAFLTVSVGYYTSQQPLFTDPGSYDPARHRIAETLRLEEEAVSQLNAKSCQVLDQDGDALSQALGLRILRLRPTLVTTATNRACAAYTERPGPLWKPKRRDEWIYPLVDDRTIYIPTTGNTERELRIVKIAIADGALTAGDTVPIGSTLGLSMDCIWVWNASLSDGRICVASCGAGLFVFTTEGALVRRITQDDGLPQNDVLSAAHVNGTVVAGLGGRNPRKHTRGHLIRIDLATGRCRTLVSSEVDDEQSPFGSGNAPYVFDYVTGDPERHRVLFVSNTRSPKPRNGKPGYGVWQLDLETDALNQVLCLNDAVYWASPMRQGKILLMCRTGDRRDGRRYVVSLDCTTDTPQLVYADRDFNPGADLTALKPLIQGNVRPNPPCALVDDWLWVSAPYGRIDPAGAFEALPHPPGKGNPPTDLTWRAWGFWGIMEPFNAGNSILVGDTDGVVMVDLKRPSRE